MSGSLAERQRELTTSLAAELAGVVGALLGSNAAAVASTGPLESGWRVACDVTGALEGAITLTVSDADASTLARRLMGMDEDPDADAVTDTLGEVVGQAAGSLGQQPVAGGAKIRVSGAAERGAALPAGSPAVFDVAMEDGTSLRFGCWVRLDAEAAAAADSQAAGVPPGVPAGGPAGGQVAAPGGAMPGRPAAAPAQPPAFDNLEVILDIELPLTVRFGKAEMTLRALTQVGPGSVIDLDRSPDEPVEILVNEKVIARGEVVVVSGNYGVRVTEVTSAADRIRTLGA
jgi:flagellar motor switch protein FliN/FliY